MIRFASDWIKTDRQIGMIVGLKNGQDYIKAASIVASINDDGGTNIKLEADTIDIDGLITALHSKILITSEIQTGQVTCTDIYGSNLNLTNDIDARYVTVDKVTTPELVFDSQAVSWKSITFEKITGMTNSHYFLYSTGASDMTPSGAASGKLIAASTEVTIHYMGY